MISVIIPAKNEEKLIKLLLDSLKIQDCAKEVEIIVADAHSTDRTREVVQKYRTAFKNVLIVDGGMPWTGRNLGAKAASGDLLVFIDADLILPERYFLTKINNAFREHNISIATVYLKPISNKLIDHILVGSYNVILYLAQFVRPLGAMCIMATREAFEKSGGYPEDVVMSEDHDFVLYARQYGKYGIVPISARISVRRFEKEGRWGLVSKYIYATYYRVVYGPIRKPIFEYEFEYDDIIKKT
ncbi:MAG: teichoic acid biosynthesis protein [Parcubacteria group bacterium]|nr:teichoic acid biosynthesis protein [Parcubacteria group bacterium]